MFFIRYKSIILYLSTFLFILIGSSLYGFGGKPIKIEDVRPYYTAREDVKIDVYIFDVVSADTNFNYLSQTVANSIAKQIEYNKTITVGNEYLYLQPVDFERVYNYKVYTFTNIEYKIDLDEEDKTKITTNIIYKYYTNFGKIKSNINIITYTNKNFELKTNEMLYDYKGETVILNNKKYLFDKRVVIGDSFLKYNGEDIENYIFTRDSDFAIYGKVEVTRRLITITTYIADIKARTIKSYKIDLTEALLDEELPSYAFDIANRINAMQKTGIISLDITPPGALVYVDNVFIGRSDNTLYLSSITTNSHRFTIIKDSYETIDTMIAFEKVGEDAAISFKLNKFDNIGKISMNVPGGTNTSVVLNGIKQNPTNLFEASLPFGTYSLKITNVDYKPYYATVSVSNTNTLSFTPNMQMFKPPTLAQRIFGNYERNMKIFLGLTVATSVFTLGTYIYANEMLDSKLIKYYDKYKNDPNPPLLDISSYNNTMTVYWVGLGVSLAFALTSGIYYMLWIAESDFPVETISFSVTPKSGAAFTFAKRF